MADRVTRFGVSLPGKLVERFDRLIEDLGYSNRSKAIADAVREFITQKRPRSNGKATGTISYLYDHHVSDVNKKLVELQHKHETSIKSTMHSHITHAECVEVLIVEGEAVKIRELYGGLSAIRGVENCKLSILK
ncbi:MAG: nickel-responsive transcriptional regulator NikR [Candidatus Altiarchaeales archaeon]|nr:nickel-responsive transcriptional regulator NikR [Candidatus Altiarchaeales archaeon]MBD3416857.1 nickel-responsive transcriptional regulator NikR [Candidatus Altiarchaeales archaeon]